MPQWFGSNNIGKLENLGSNILKLNPSFLKISGKAVKTEEIQLNLNNLGLGGLDSGVLSASKIYNIFAVLENSIVYLIASESETLNYSFYLKIAAVYTDSNSIVSKIVQDYLTDNYLDFFSEVNDIADFEIASIQCSNFSSKFLSYNSWKDISYGNGVYLIVGNSNKFAYSSNAESFSIINTSKNYNSCCYGDKLFVLVGNNSLSYTFSGLFIINPPNISKVPNKNWVNVINYGSKFYILASTGDVLEFNRNALFGNEDYYLKTCNISSLSQKEIAFGNDIFVSVGSSLIYSNNLNTWQKFNSSENYLSITFGRGKFLTITSSKIYLSNDGVSWDLVYTAESDQSFLKVKYTGGVFVVVGLNTFLMSLDGLTWKSKTVPSGNSYNTIVFGKGNFISLNSSLSNFLISMNR